MRFLFAIILLMLGAGIGSCASLTRARLSQISSVHPGQSKSQVTSILGEPEQRVRNQNSEIWSYRVYSNDSSHVYFYAAKFENGSLRSFELNDARNTEDRALRDKRKNADQTVIDINGTNGSPPISE